MNKGDRVKFDHMGIEYEGVVLEVTSSAIGFKPYNLVRVKADAHALCITVNTTMFPQRVRRLKENDESQ